MNEATSGLIDIIEPLAPVTVNAGFPLIWLVAAVVVLLLAIVVAWRYRQRCQYAARKRVRRLRLSLLTGELSQQQTAYALAAELSQRFKLQRLQAEVPPKALHSSHHADWGLIVTQLNQLRYQPGTRLEAANLTHLFSMVDAILRRSGRC